VRRRIIAIIGFRFDHHVAGTVDQQHRSGQIASAHGGSALEEAGADGNKRAPMNLNHRPHEN
jgi:hypothetical protein